MEPSLEQCPDLSGRQAVGWFCTARRWFSSPERVAYEFRRGEAMAEWNFPPQEACELGPEGLLELVVADLQLLGAEDVADSGKGTSAGNSQCVVSSAG